jgi:hypothetical protein
MPDRGNQRPMKHYFKSLTIIFLFAVAFTFPSIHFQPAQAAINSSLITIQSDGSVEVTTKIRVDAF